MQFQHPCNVIVAGPTKAGKTEFVKRLVSHANAMFSPPPAEIWWCYGEWQPTYHDQPLIDRVKFVEGFPDQKELRGSAGVPKLLVLDDLMQDVKEKSLSKLFSQGTHHGNISCVHIVQNLFYGNNRTSRVNAQYIILMKNPSDKLQASNLGKQLFPGKLPYFLESYGDACRDAFGYLAIDLSQETQEEMRLRTKIFPGEEHIAYVPKEV